MTTTQPKNYTEVNGRRGVVADGFAFVAHPAAGATVEIDGWKTVSVLEACMDWDAAEFRIACGGGLVRLAVNLTITGRTRVKRHGGYMVRVRLDVPKDGDEGGETLFGYVWADDFVYVG